MSSFARSTVRRSATYSLTFVLLVVCCANCPGQGRDRRDQPSEKQLELRLEKAQEALVGEFSDVASQLYKQGARERSLEILKKLQRMTADLPGLQDKIDEIQEELMSDNEMALEFDVSRGWGTPLARVGKGKGFRIAVLGEYRMTFSATVPLTGLPMKDPMEDHVKDAPFGALIGVIVSDGKPGKPFPVTESLQMTPKEDGQLFIRVNVPAAAKCTGKLDVQLSGYVQPVSNRR